MKVAVLKGNRFNPWHMKGFAMLRGNPEVVAFRAESEIQRRYEETDSGSFAFHTEPIFFDTEAGNPLTRAWNVLTARYRNREPRILPFADRLRGYDVTVSWELFTDWSAQAAEARERFTVPLAVVVWDNIPFNQEQPAWKRENKKRVLQAADRLVVYTERSRRTLLIEGAPASRIVRIDPGVDMECFQPGPGDRRALGLAEDDFVVLFVGWLFPRKGIDFLLLALHQLLADMPELRPRLRFVAVSAELGRERVQRLVSRLGLDANCRFVEPLPYDAMPPVFRCADVFALPSIASETWQEQFGMALIEAMASGIPVISTRSGAIEEVVGDAGILCQPNDFVSLLDALKRLIREPALREDLAGRGRQRAVERFDLRTHAEAFSDLFESLVRA